MASNVPPSVWEDIRQAFARGWKPKAIVVSEELRRVCTKFRIDAKSISDKAYRERWKVERDETRKIVEETRPTAVAAVVVDEIAKTTREQLDLATKGAQKLLAALDVCDGPSDVKDWLAALRTLQQIQRLALNQAPPKADETAADSGGISIIPADSDDWHKACGNG